MWLKLGLQHVKREAAQELDRLQLHDSAPRTVGVVLIEKADRPRFRGHEPLVVDRRAVDVASEILEHLRGSSE
jgi:hypothetical protein